MFLSIVLVSIFQLVLVQQLISGSFPLSYRKHNSLRCSEYLELCCVDLASAAIYPSDKHIIYLNQFQRLVEEAGGNDDDRSFGMVTERQVELVALSVTNLRSKLSSIK